jgi:hypothetical protein
MERLRYDEVTLLVDGGVLAHAVLRVRPMGIARRGAVRERGEWGRGADGGGEVGAQGGGG